MKNGLSALTTLQLSLMELYHYNIHIHELCIEFIQNNDNFSVHSHGVHNYVSKRIGCNNWLQ